MLEKKIFHFLILLNSLSFSKNYYEKFEEAFQLYKDGRFRLSEQKFKNIGYWMW